MNKSLIIGAVIGAIGVTAGGALATYGVMASKQPDHVQVVSAQPVHQAISTPQQSCREVAVTRRKPVQDQHQIAGSVLGAVAGGLLGNQVGGGSGRAIATVAGAVGGGYAGNKIQENLQARNTYTTTETRCDTVQNKTQKLVGYDVSYEKDGQVRQVRMDHDPGTSIPLDSQGRLVLVKQ
ncbi:MAG: glycine zipper 2TM domain-containing protein [Comamonas sp.]